MRPETLLARTNEVIEIPRRCLAAAHGGSLPMT